MHNSWLGYQLLIEMSVPVVKISCGNLTNSGKNEEVRYKWNLFVLFRPRPHLSGYFLKTEFRFLLI